MITFDKDGLALLTSTILVEDINELRREFSELDFKAGARPFSLSPLVKRLMQTNGCFGKALETLSINNAVPIRVLAFDKTPASNWNLGWHQDRVVALKERRETDSFKNWTVKNNRHHAEAPAEVLKGMFALRLHLDDCGKDNGALRAISGSHLKGKLTDAEVRSLAASCVETICEASRGDILAMKALTIHASSPALNPTHRRVLHIDYCTTLLPNGLEWALN